MKQEEKAYLSDVELEKLIAEVENTQMKQAPEYLQQMILRKAEHNAVKDSVEIIPIRNAIKEGTPVLPKEQTKWIQMLTYSTKIAVAAAAAIALIIVVPQAERDAEQYSKTGTVQQEEVKEKHHSILREFNTVTGEFCNKLFETTNLIFQREDKTDDTEKE